MQCRLCGVAVNDIQQHPNAKTMYVCAECGSLYDSYEWERVNAQLSCEKYEDWLMKHARHLWVPQLRPEAAGVGWPARNYIK